MDLLKNLNVPPFKLQYILEKNNKKIQQQNQQKLNKKIMKDKSLTYAQKYYRTHREKVLENNKRYYQKKKHTPK